jgi:GMP synthase-like glutamine amidotransferase
MTQQTPIDATPAADLSTATDWMGTPRSLPIADPTASATVRILVIEHDPADPVLRLGEWLTEAGAELTINRPYLGDTLPAELTGFDALISMGGEMGARDDDIAPWLPATRALLSTGVRTSTPTLGICLGGQLLAAATGGTVRKGPDGPELGAHLTAKRDAAMSDPLFADVPMTPDVMQYHYDVVSTLPQGAVLLLSSTGYPNQAWRQGPAAWGLQFHIEPTAENVRDWARKEDRPLTGRFGPSLDAAEETIGEVWREFAHRFVAFARDHDPAAGVAPGTATAAGAAAEGLTRPLLPVVAIGE